MLTVTPIVLSPYWPKKNTLWISIINRNVKSFYCILTEWILSRNENEWDSTTHITSTQMNLISRTWKKQNKIISCKSMDNRYMFKINVHHMYMFKIQTQVNYSTKTKAKLKIESLVTCRKSFLFLNLCFKCITVFFGKMCQIVHLCLNKTLSL
jgi:hypothetical protein